jgi:hypothetical protein
LALAAAHRAALFLRTWLPACALARIAGLAGGYVYFLFGTKNSLSETYPKIVKEICSWSGRTPRPPHPCSKTKKVLEYVTKGRKDIFETTKPGESCALQPRVAKLVVEVALLRVPQDFISLSSLFKFIFGLFITWITIRVKLEGELTISLFYLFLRGSSIDT